MTATKLYNRRLLDQLQTLGLDPTTLPKDPSTWQQLLEAIDTFYDNLDEAAGPRLDALTRNVRDVIFQLDLEGRWLFLNTAWVALTGLPVTAALGERLVDYLHPDDQATIGEVLLTNRAAATQRMLLPIRLRTQFGDYCQVQLRIEPLLNAQNQVIGSTGALLVDAGESERPDGATSRHGHADSVLRGVLNDLSHDLRTPLTVIESYVSLARRSIADDPKVAQFLETAQLQTRRIARILDDITTFSHLEYGSESFVLTSINLNEVLNEVVLQLAPSARTKHSDLHAIFAADLPVIRGDRLWLAQMIKSLISNAIQHTSEYGFISVATQLVNDHVMLAVQDNGAGIPAADLAHIFDQFFRAERHRPQHNGGAGLGLAIVKKIVDLHGGQIDVETQVGQGTTFRIYFPYYY